MYAYSTINYNIAYCIKFIDYIAVCDKLDRSAEGDLFNVIM